MLRSFCRFSTAFWRALSASISALRVAMSLIWISSFDLGDEELVALLLRRGQLLHRQVPDADDREAGDGRDAQPMKKATLRRLRRSSWCGSRLMRIT